MKKNMSKLVVARLILSGSLLGVVLFSMVAPWFGIDQSQHKELLSAGLGGGVVAILFKLTHLI